MLKKIIIHIDDQEQEVTIGSAKKVDGIRRSELMLNAIALTETASKQVAFWLYPTCISAVREPESVKNMPLEDFMSRVDEADIDLWMEAAYECNPHWRSASEALAKVGSEISEKKIMMPSYGSLESMETQTKTSETFLISPS